MGRIKKEKGVFSLIKLINDLDIDYDLSIVGDPKKLNLENDKIKVFNETSNRKKIINFYDQNNIFILPSFTEGSPKVILESLSRLRPVIVFREIKHVKSKFKGVFIAKMEDSLIKIKNRKQVTELLYSNKVYRSNGTYKEFKIGEEITFKGKFSGSGKIKGFGLNNVIAIDEDGFIYIVSYKDINKPNNG